MASQLPEFTRVIHGSWNSSDNCSVLLARLRNGSIAYSDSLIKCGPVVYTIAQAIAVAILLLLLTIGTAGGNMLIILAILLVRKLRSPSNLLIVNLALTDFLVSILVLPFAIAYQVLGYWPFNQHVCDFYTMFDVLLCTSSILSLCAISIDRYLAITKPLRYASKRTPKRMLMMIFISWFLSAAISIPPVFGWEKRISPYFCGYSEELSYQIYATFSAFYIPLIVMLVLYGKIFILARQMAAQDACKYSYSDAANRQTHNQQNRNSVQVNNQNVPETYENFALACVATQENNKKISSDESQRNALVYNCSNNNDNRTAHHRLNHRFRQNRMQDRSKNNSIILRKNSSTVDVDQPARILFKSPRKSSKSETHKAVSTLGVIMGCFTLCWLPFFLCQLITPIVNALLKDRMFYFPPTLFQVFLWLGYMNSFLNPIIYALFNHDFRTPFVYILRCQCANINTRIRNDTFVYEIGLPEKSSLKRRSNPRSDSLTNRSASRPRRPTHMSASRISNTHNNSYKISVVTGPNLKTTVAHPEELSRISSEITLTSTTLNTILPTQKISSASLGETIAENQ